MNGQELISVPIEPGEGFTIRYIHSVDISPVYEVFYADEKKGLSLKRPISRCSEQGWATGLTGVG